jgi:hypothetical protein
MKTLFLVLFFSGSSAAFAQSICIAHHPIYIEGVAEIDYSAGCSGHDEPELFPVSSQAGSARELTWTAVLPADASGLVSDVGPTFWFGGVVSDPTSLFGQAYVELQFYPDAIVQNCFPNGGYNVKFAANTFTACSPVWSVTTAGKKNFKEPAAFNAMLVDSASPREPLNMHGGDTITVHWFTTAAQDGFHVTVNDLTTNHSGTIILNSSHAGPLMPAFDKQLVGNSLGWGVVNDAPNAFVWEIGHTSNFTSSAALCLPGQTVCDSYKAASWAAFTPIRIVSVTFGDGSSPENWGVVSDQGGIAEVNASCFAYGGPFCIYPWYTLSSSKNGGFHYGIDYPDTKKDYGQASQFTQTPQCGGAAGPNTTFCSTLLQ